MSKFTMPAIGTPEFEALKLRWSAKPVSFGQCTRIKALMRDVQATGGWHGRVHPNQATRLDFLAERDDDGRWTKIRTDSGELTMWKAHALMEILTSLLVSPVVESTTTPKPAKGHRKVTVEAIEGDQVSGVILESGQLVMVRTSTGVETKRVLVNGARVTLGRP
jgi:hypothetical protein